MFTIRTGVGILLILFASSAQALAAEGENVIPPANTQNHSIINLGNHVIATGSHMNSNGHVVFTGNKLVSNVRSILEAKGQMREPKVPSQAAAAAKKIASREPANVKSALDRVLDDVSKIENAAPIHRGIAQRGIGGRATGIVSKSVASKGFVTARPAGPSNSIGAIRSTGGNAVATTVRSTQIPVRIQTVTAPVFTVAPATAATVNTNVGVSITDPRVNVPAAAPRVAAPPRVAPAPRVPTSTVNPRTQGDTTQIHAFILPEK